MVKEQADRAVGAPVALHEVASRTCQSSPPSSSGGRVASGSVSATTTVPPLRTARPRGELSSGTTKSSLDLSLSPKTSVATSTSPRTASRADFCASIKRVASARMVASSAPESMLRLIVFGSLEQAVLALDVLELLAEEKGMLNCGGQLRGRRSDEVDLGLGMDVCPPRCDRQNAQRTGLALERNDEQHARALAFPRASGSGRSIVSATTTTSRLVKAVPAGPSTLGLLAMLAAHSGVMPR